MIFAIAALALVALALGLYLIASHYNVTAQIGDLIMQVICFIESWDHPFVIGIALLVLGLILLVIAYLMRRSAYRIVRS